jgi:chromosome segregation ATPase
MSLRREIEEATGAVADERERVAKLRDAVGGGQSSLSLGSYTYSHEQLTQELARRFSHLREAETALTTKKQLLEARERSLTAAQDALESAKAQKATLTAQIEGLDAQYQLVQAASVSSPVPASFDTSKLAQAKTAIARIRNDLLVTERVMAYEAKFTQSPATAIATNETELLSQVDSHFQRAAATPTAVAGALPAPESSTLHASPSDAGK